MEVMINCMRNKISRLVQNNLKAEKIFFIIILFLACYGAYLRCVNTFSGNNFGLWFDEAVVSSMISDSIFKSITDMGLVRPILYLLTMKGSILVCGNNEYAFRLPSLIFSIISIALFIHLIKSIFNGKFVQLIVVFLFLFNPYIINHSGEAKAYSYEILLYIIVLVCLVHYIKSSRRIFLIILMCMSLLTPVLSVTLVFILPSIYMVVVYDLIKRSNKKSVIVVICCAVVSVLLILGFYIKLFGSETQGGVSGVQWYHSAGFFPLHNENIILYYVNSLSGMIDFFTSCPVFIPQGFVAKNFLSMAYIVVFVVGCFWVVKNAKGFAVIFILPFILLIGFNIAGQWPFGAFRVNFFVASVVLCVVGYGLQQLILFPKDAMERRNIVITVVMICVFFQFPFSAKYYRNKESVQTGSSQCNKALKLIFSDDNPSSRRLIISNVYGFQALSYYMNYCDRYKAVNSTNCKLFFPGLYVMVDAMSIDSIVKNACKNSVYDSIWIVWDQFSSGEAQEYMKYAMKNKKFVKQYRTTLLVKYK